MSAERDGSTLLHFADKDPLEYIGVKKKKVRLPCFKIFLKYEESTGEYEGSKGGSLFPLDWSSWVQD